MRAEDAAADGGYYMHELRLFFSASDIASLTEEMMRTHVQLHWKARKSSRGGQDNDDLPFFVYAIRTRAYMNNIGRPTAAPDKMFRVAQHGDSSEELYRYIWSEYGWKWVFALKLKPTENEIAAIAAATAASQARYDANGRRLPRSRAPHTALYFTRVSS